MYIVDAHVHVQDHSWIPLQVRCAWARQASTRTFPFRDPDEILPRVMLGQSDGDARLTLTVHRRLGVSAGVIPVIDWSVVGDVADNPGDLSIDEVNRRTATLCDGAPQELFHLPGVDPRNADARGIVERALASSQSRGLKLYPAAGWVADDERYGWLYDEIIEREMVALIHTSPLGGDPLVTSLSRPSALAPVLKRHPSLTLVFAHAGFEAWWLEALDIAHGWRGTYLEVSLWQQIAERDYREFRTRMTTLVSRMGAHRVIFGSDTLRGIATDPDGADLERWIDQFRSLAEDFDGSPAVVSDEQLALMLGENARRVYRLPEAVSHG